VKKYKGVVDDYLPIHNFIDSSKANVPDIRHRAMLHSSWGIYIVEQVFGNYIVNSDDKTVSVRDIAEDHVLQDLGFIPTMEKWLNHMTIEKWMSGSAKHTKIIDLLEIEPVINTDSSRPIYYD